jgi:hypothetical protein
VGISQTEPLENRQARPVAFREIELYAMGRFIGVEDGSPAGSGRVLMFFIK